jgi:DNA-binding IclR family transcriptional regulator
MLEKASAVLDLFTEAHPELGAPEIAARLRRPRSTVYRLLGRMAEAGFLDQDEATGRFRPGMRLALLGEVARQSTSLQRQAHPALVAVSEATG